MPGITPIKDLKAFEGRAVLIKIQKQRRKDGKALERRRAVPIDAGTLGMVREYLEWRKQFPYKRGDCYHAKDLS